MKKIMMAAAVALAITSCGNDESNDSNASEINQAPMGDTANQINSNAGNYTGDTSNSNGDDSVSGSNPASRRTTPGNDTSRRSF